MVTIGNFINSGTNRANAFGIKLKSLVKFGDTKDNKGHSILYNVFQIAKQIQEQQPPSEQYVKYLEKIKENPYDTDLEYQKDSIYLLQSLEELCAIVDCSKKTSFPDESDAFDKFNRQLSTIKQTVDDFNSGPTDQYK